MSTIVDCAQCQHDAVKYEKETKTYFRKRNSTLPSNQLNQPRGVLARYALILDIVASSRTSLSLTEIRRSTGFPGGSIHRLLNSLLDVGYLALEERQKRYRVGPQLIRLFHLAHSRVALSTLTLPVLQTLTARFSETAFVAKLDSDGVESIVSAVPDNYTQSHVQPGRIMPINAAASAKAIFAFQSKSAVERQLATPLKKYTEKTIVDKAELLESLAEVREQGYAVCSEELDPGVLTYACPIQISGIEIIYSVGLVGLQSRLSQFARSEVIGALSEAARIIATRLEGELKFSETAGSD